VSGDNSKTSFGDGGTDESEKQRIDRELIELLNELRVALPGVQVLFAFLLTLPFSNGFTKVSASETDVYAASLLLAATATGLLIAPSSLHRLRFRTGKREKEDLLLTSNRLAIFGLLLLALAMGCAVYVIMAVVFSFGPALGLALGTGAWFGWFWYGLALRIRLRN
jgi:hypothetical protein